MSFLQSEKIDDAKIAFDTRFNKALAELSVEERFWERLAMRIDTNVPTIGHKWLGDVPGLSKWVDTRSVGKLQAESFQVTVEDWASALEVDINDIKDDNLGLYAPKLSQMARKAFQHRLNLMMDYLANGFDTAKYGASFDGQALFADSHPHPGGGTYDNKMTATLDDSGAFAAALQLAREIKGDDGEPMGIRPSVLICGPKYEETALKLLVASTLANGATNVFANRMDLFISDKLTGDHDDKWFIADLRGDLKPLIFQVRQEIQPGEVTDGHDAFHKRKLYFGYDARYAVAYGAPFMIVGSDGTT